MHEIIGFLTGLVALVVPGFGTVPAPVYFGYVEADYTYVAPISAGPLTQITVREGDSVKKGTLLFSQTKDQYQAALDAAQAKVAAAEATLRNLESGSRQAEIDVIKASLAQAQSELSLAQTSLERTQKLYATGVVSSAARDSAQTAVESASAKVQQLKAQLEVAELPARNDQIKAAEANLNAARAEAVQAKIALGDRDTVSPATGIVQRVFFSRGEMAPAGQPVLSILPPEAMKVRFFIPETERGQFTIGDKFDITCDGCKSGYTATLSFLAEDPQNTPPVIYSRDERARMVFMAEARFAHVNGLLPGQPVTIAPVNGEEGGGND